MTPFPDPDENQSGAYYRRLEVGPAASHDEIVRAYRRLALGAHPDAHPEDPEATKRFREITEAYEVLADPERREAYDRSSVFGRILVRRRAPTTKDTRESSSPVFLGGPRVRLTPDVPLRIGPVQIGDPSPMDVPTSSSLLRALFEILDSWGAG